MNRPRDDAVVSSARTALIGSIADALTAPRPRRRRRIGIDGRDGAGKTRFADELATALVERRLEVVRATVDRFHNPREVRYHRGRGSAEGFYLDSYDLVSLRRLLLEPAGPDGDGRVVLGIHDVERDVAVVGEERVIPPGGVLLVDGIFLHRSELVEVWDASVYLHVEPAIAVARCADRDDGEADIEAPSNARYLGGQALYHERCHPEARATWVVDNGDLAAPRVVRRPADGAVTRGR